MIAIELNGNRGVAAPIEALLEVLKSSTINPYFGVDALPRSDRVTRQVLVTGSFVDRSWVYRVRASNGSEEGERLFRAVWESLNSEQFLRAAKGYPIWPQHAFPAFAEMAKKLGISPVHPWKNPRGKSPFLTRGAACTA